jgi:hypothetical protein
MKRSSTIISLALALLAGPAVAATITFSDLTGSAPAGFRPSASVVIGENTYHVGARAEGGNKATYIRTDSSGNLTTVPVDHLAPNFGLLEPISSILAGLANDGLAVMNVTYPEGLSRVYTFNIFNNSEPLLIPSGTGQAGNFFASGITDDGIVLGISSTAPETALPGQTPTPLENLGFGGIVLASRTGNGGNWYTGGVSYDGFSGALAIWREDSLFKLVDCSGSFCLGRAMDPSITAVLADVDGAVGYAYLTDTTISLFEFNGENIYGIGWEILNTPVGLTAFYQSFEDGLLYAANPHVGNMLYNPFCGITGICPVLPTDPRRMGVANYNGIDSVVVAFEGSLYEATIRVVPGNQTSPTGEVPEPSTYLLVGTALLLLVNRARAKTA